MAGKHVRAKKMQVIAREERQGDVTVVKFGYAENGSLVVSEEASGPSAVVAYGEPTHKLRMIFSSEAVEDLLALLGEQAHRNGEGAALRVYFKDGEHALIDLMDSCDARSIAYSFQSLGSATGVTYRPGPASSQGRR